MAKAAAKTEITSAFEYLALPDKHPPARVCTVYGDDEYLKSEVLLALRHQVLAGEESDFGLTVFTGREVRLRDVHDALATVSLFGSGRRLVVIEEADPFVTEFRGELEDFISKPLRGVLVLEVKTWPGNTRLAKLVAGNGLTIDCRSLESLKGQELKASEREMKKWLVEKARTQHDVRLDPAAAEALADLLPPEPGILIQEVARLALLVALEPSPLGRGQGEGALSAGDLPSPHPSPRGRESIANGSRSSGDRAIDAKLVRDNVGGWRTRATWDMVDAAADGRAADALAQLDRLIASGEKPHGLLPQMASSLRRFSAAIDLIEAAEADGRRLPAREALAQAGVLPFKLNDAERQFRQIGRRRARILTQWLLAADLAMKSHNSADDRARIELERLIVKLQASGASGTTATSTATRR